MSFGIAAIFGGIYWLTSRPFDGHSSRQVPYMGIVTGKGGLAFGVIVQDERIIEAGDNGKFLVGWPVWKVEEDCKAKGCKLTLYPGIPVTK